MPRQSRDRTFEPNHAFVGHIFILFLFNNRDFQREINSWQIVNSNSMTKLSR
ncbi:hypothetical protein H1P_6500005 [Hyella patelloides LEGE 07179]|uniref:Uncharacterized protein n=1 Tax=Hyella patelloides LEGE 07179 TaxID=945734 RepID=A0A563W2J1_9CYAN|nr:hypothetical protein H1P_6500005 [Hyella patelloides LEGE 07179]